MRAERHTPPPPPPFGIYKVFYHFFIEIINFFLLATSLRAVNDPNVRKLVTLRKSHVEGQTVVSISGGGGGGGGTGVCVSCGDVIPLSSLATH